MSSTGSAISWWREPRRLVLIAISGLSVVYPAVVWLYHGVVAPQLFVLFALLLVGVRMALMAPDRNRPWRLALAAVAIFLVVLAAVAPDVGTKAYPVLLSLAASYVFAQSLISPPSLIERMARVRRATVSEGLRLYCRNLTVIWSVWLLANAAIAAVLAVQGSDQMWALWTGCLSYVLSGVLLVGEMGVRRAVLRKQGA
ncbi:MAG: hypothetical protein JO055_01060 [Alphaproteobacteria bacterium]|nr:hypothetical protein [Alphaproteobacteria bacterium]